MSWRPSCHSTYHTTQKVTPTPLMDIGMARKQREIILGKMAGG
jgi:hypothetical protein